MKNLVIVFDEQHARQRDLPISVYLDIRTGQLTIGYLSAQAHAKKQQLVFQWPLPQDATSAELAKLINTHLALFDQLLDNADVIHHNHKQTGLLDASAKKAIEKLNAIFSLYSAVNKNRLCADLSDWLNGKLYNDDYPDVDSFANYILSCDGDNNIYFSSFLNEHDSMVNEILLLWQEDFENGNDLPDYAIKTFQNYPLLHTTTNNKIATAKKLYPVCWSLNL